LVGRHYLAQHLSQQLLIARTRDEAVSAIEGLILLDASASNGIVAGLQSEDFFVARTAFRTIDVQITRWEQLQRSEADARLRSLAESLNKLPASTPADNLILASSLASRLFTICMDREDVALRDVMEMCETVIGRAGQTPGTAGLTPVDSTAPPVASVAANPAEFTANLIPPPPLIPETTIQEPRETPSISDSNSSRSSLSDLSVVVHDPVDPNAEPLLTIANEGEVASSSGSARGAIRMVASPTAESAYRTASPAEQIDAPDSRASNFSLSDTTNQQAFSQSVGDVESKLVPAGDLEPSVQTLAGIERLPIKELVRLLASVQPKISQTAAVTLKRHGMSDAKLELAMALATGTEQQRLELIGQIASRSDLDPRVWLIWMAQDGQPAVRARAVSELNSMLDLDVMRELRQQLNRERDPQVAQLIRQVLMTPAR
jgi:hypothetical protein